MSYNVTVCHRCGECTYDPDYKRCLNDDCHLAPLANGLRVGLLIAAALMLLLVAAGHPIN